MRDDLVDGQAVDVPDLDGVGAGAGHGDAVHGDVGVGGAVAVEADAEAVGQVHGDLAEGEVADAGELQAEVRRAGHCEVGDRDACLVDGADGAAAAVEADIDGAAAFECLAA